MDKVKVYRRAGITCLSIWGVVTLAVTVLFVVMALRDVGEAIGSLPITILLAVIGGVGLSFIYNPLFFIGAIFFWRAQQNRIPPEKSGWLGFILTYLFILIFLMIMVFIAVTQVKNARLKARQEWPDIRRIYTR